MKHINKILLLMTLLAGFSCTREELSMGEQDGKAPRIVIAVDDAEQARSRTATTLPSEPGTVDERAFNSIYLYVFQGTTLVEQQKVENLNTTSHSMRLSDDLLDKGKLTFYAFASPAGVTMPQGNGVTKAALDALVTTGMSQHTAPAADGELLYANVRNIPMAAIKEHNLKNSPLVSIQIKRVVSKLRVRAVNKITIPGYTFDVDNIEFQVKNNWNSVGYVSKESNPTGSTARFTSQWITMGAHNETTTTVAPIATNKWAYAYVNENLSTTRSTVTINLPYTYNGVTTPINRYDFPLNFNLERNYIYQLVFNVYSLGDGLPIDVEVFLEIIPWLGVVETDPIE